MNGSDWMKQFITRILHMSHSQWIFRNFTLHNKLQGTIKLRERTDVLAEVVTLAEMDPSTLPLESHFLLEMDFSTLKRSPLERQSYWVQAMKAARRAGQRKALVQSRRSASARRREAKYRHPIPRINTAVVEEQMQAELRMAPSAPYHRDHVASIELNLCSNKRLKKPD